ncbi:MAG: SUMF1/EgtB/PvdO family nonheme iron enzyme [Bacteroidota bacterium]
MTRETVEGLSKPCSKKFEVSHRKGENRVLRGGNWLNDARNCRVSNRNRNEPDNRDNNVGFRLALSPAHGKAG